MAISRKRLRQSTKQESLRVAALRLEKKEIKQATRLARDVRRAAKQLEREIDRANVAVRHLIGSIPETPLNAHQDAELPSL